MVFERELILDRLNAQITKKKYIIGVVTGAGISAKYTAKGGADLILALNSGRFRQMGLGSKKGFEVVIFHATGTGGKTMEI